MGVQLPLPAPSSISLSHFVLVTYACLRDAPQSDRVPLSGTNSGTVPNPRTLNDLEGCGSFMASRRCVRFRLLTLDYGLRGG